MHEPRYLCMCWYAGLLGRGKMAKTINPQPATNFKATPLMQ